MNYLAIIDTRKEERAYVRVHAHPSHVWRDPPPNPNNREPKPPNYRLLAKDKDEHNMHLVDKTKSRVNHALASCAACCCLHRRRRRPASEGEDEGGQPQQRRQQQQTPRGLGARLRGFFMERRDTLGKMVAEREQELEREIEMAELETWGALNGAGLVCVCIGWGVDRQEEGRGVPDHGLRFHPITQSPNLPTVNSLPKPPQHEPAHPPSYLWHQQQQQGTGEAVSPFNSSAGGASGGALISPPSLAATRTGSGGTGTSTPQQQQHSVVLVQPSPHRPVASHIFSSRGSSRAASPGPVRATDVTALLWMSMR